jgi:hypothetical protein
MLRQMKTELLSLAFLQWTAMMPFSPAVSWVRVTWLIKSNRPLVDSGTVETVLSAGSAYSESAQPRYWNCFTAAVSPF